MPKHGEIRGDGMVFWGMTGKHQDWRSPDKFYAAKKRNYDNKIRIKKIRRRWLNIYKKSKGCSLCGYKEHPAALQFDHLDPSTKVRDVSNMVTLKLKRLMDEVRKCRVLCANCHMIHTFGENK